MLRLSAATSEDRESAERHAPRCQGGASLKIEDTTHLGVYRSSDWAERCFCNKCGTVLFYRLVYLGMLLTGLKLAWDGFLAG